jgi:uncharacterized membrane protein (UPF0127 family)
VKILNQTRNTTLAERAKLADTVISRMVGLLDCHGLNAGDGLIITRCQQIHMFFMKFAIDAVFIDASSRVVGLVQEIRPWQVSPIFWKANRVIELPTGTILATETSVNDLLQILR